MTSEHNASVEMYHYIVTTEVHRQQSFKHQAGRLYTALLLALLMHTLILQSPLPQASEHAPKARPISILEVEFANTVQASEPQPTQETTQAIQQEKPIIHPEPKKVIRHIPQPKKKAVKPTKKKNKKPEKKTTQKPQHPPKKEPTTPTSASAPAAHASTALKTTPAHPATPPTNTAARQQYIQSILGHINHHKHYPYSARRRHMEDDVRVSLVVHADGHISDIQIQGKHSVLTRATRQAIQDALPFAAPPMAQMRISFTMRYRLK